jgi:hypothetical protein
MYSRLFQVVGLVFGIILTSCSTETTTPTPMTSWGHPDLQGVWDYRTITPLEKPDELGDRAEFTAEEAVEYTRTEPDRVAEQFAPLLVVGGEPWADPGTTLSEEGRASLITDPPSGKLPQRTEYGEQTAALAFAQFLDVPDGPEDRPVQERCIIYPRIPLTSGNYNNNVQIVQTPTHVVLLMEMMHDARIVPLDDRPLLPVRSWLGQSRGHWDGETLVVETTAFRAYPTALGHSPDMRLTERFTRRGDKLIYEYTVDDPQAFNAAWSARQTLRATDDRVFEYACHEANYSMAGSLRGARLQEQEELATASGSG